MINTTAQIYSRKKRKNVFVYSKIWLKDKCAVCGGSLFVEEDDVGDVYVKCLMCMRSYRTKETIKIG